MLCCNFAKKILYSTSAEILCSAFEKILCSSFAKNTLHYLCKHTLLYHTHTVLDKAISILQYTLIVCLHLNYKAAEGQRGRFSGKTGSPSCLSGRSLHPTHRNSFNLQFVKLVGIQNFFESFLSNLIKLKHGVA